MTAMNIALGMILGPEPDDLVLAWFQHHASFFQRIYVAVDDRPDSNDALNIVKRWEHPGLVVFRRGLQGDFAAQRNAVAKRLAEDWLLMLDADERLDTDAMSILPEVLNKTLKNNPGMRVVGMSRRNLIDGVDTGVWPDWQFRLVIRGVRWRNTSPSLDASPGCHEFPLETHDNPDSVMLLPNIVIKHSKSSIRHLQRNKMYSAISSGRYRPLGPGPEMSE
ncbi:MAG: glycosyltransferase [Deltaproteobacteria bacterium]|nr:glycosyltransferase [Deltaproteobacteria bacterium]